MNKQLRDPNIHDLQAALKHVPTPRLVQATQLVMMGKLMKMGEKFLKRFHVPAKPTVTL